MTDTPTAPCGPGQGGPSWSVPRGVSGLGLCSPHPSPQEPWSGAQCAPRLRTEGPGDRPQTTRPPEPVFPRGTHQSPRLDAFTSNREKYMKHLVRVSIGRISARSHMWRCLCVPRSRRFCQRAAGLRSSLMHFSCQAEEREGARRRGWRVERPLPGWAAATTSQCHGAWLLSAAVTGSGHRVPGARLKGRDAETGAGAGLSPRAHELGSGVTGVTGAWTCHFTWPPGLQVPPGRC